MTVEWTTTVQTVEWTSTVDPSVTFTTAVIDGGAGGSGGAVESVNGKTGAVVLDAADVGALPADTPIPDVDGLVATDDPRLSDARAPLPHTHTAADITDLPSGGGVRLVSSETFASGPAGIEVDGLDELGSWRVVIHGACSHTTAGDRRLRWRANDDTTANAHSGAVAGRSGGGNALTETTGDSVEWTKAPQNADGVGWGRITLEHTPSPSGRPQIVAGTMHGTGQGGGAGVVNATGMWAGAGPIGSLTLWWDAAQWMDGTTVEVWEVPSA